MSGPLSTLKILDFTTLLPGPFATMMLADLGADVIRIESPSRPDVMRIRPPFDGEVSARHGLLGRSKRSVSLDVKQMGTSDVVKRLVMSYDILVEQFRPGVMDSLGLGYETLRALNPSLIYCSITGYGQTGPLRNRAGHDNNYLSLTGVMSHTGSKETGPADMGVQIADIGGGSFGAITGILAAVIHRGETGEGQAVDISMFDMALAWNSLAGAGYLVGAEVLKYESGLLNGGSYYGYYRTKDGRYLSVGCLEPKFWRNFCEAIERPNLVAKHVEALGGDESIIQEIEAVILTKTLNEWNSIFADRDACVEPVLRADEALRHPHTNARCLIVDVLKPDGSTQPQVGSPFKFSGTVPVYEHIGAALGEHTDEVLSEIGYSPTEISEMRKQGWFG